MDGSAQQDLGGCGVCMDPEYNVLWTYSPQTKMVGSFNPMTSSIQGLYLHISLRLHLG